MPSAETADRTWKVPLRAATHFFGDLPLALPSQARLSPKKWRNTCRSQENQHGFCPVRHVFLRKNGETRAAARRISTGFTRSGTSFSEKTEKHVPQPGESARVLPGQARLSPKKQRNTCRSQEKQHGFCSSRHVFLRKNGETRAFGRPGVTLDQKKSPGSVVEHRGFCVWVDDLLASARRQPMMRATSQGSA